MANLPPDGGNPDDLSLQLFDFENYYGEHFAEPASTPDTGIQGLNNSIALGRTSRFEPYQDQEGYPEVTALSQTYVDTFSDNSFESLRGPSRHPTATRNEPLHQHGQPLRTDIPNAELYKIDDELEEVELRLKRRELLKKRQELLQDMSTGQQAQSSDHHESQNCYTLNYSNTRSTSQHVASNDASRRSDLSPTATIPFNNDWVEHAYDTNLGTSGRDSIQLLNVGVDSRYAVSATNPWSFGFADFSSNAYEGSSRSEGLKESNKADAELSSLDSVLLLGGVPAGRSNSVSDQQCEMQTPVPALVAIQNTKQSSLTSLEYRPGRDSVQSASTLSSSQHDRPCQNPGTNMIIQKRPRSPQPTEAQRLSLIQHQLSRRTGVPEISLGVICFNTEPRPKRNRTRSQKQNKKNVENIGGSCFLCLIYKRKCSGQRPCESCRKYWQNGVHNSTSFMWTCDVQSKLTDFDVFSSPLASGTIDMIKSQSDGLEKLSPKYDYLFDLMDTLEPLRPRTFLKMIDGNTISHILWLCSCVQTIIRWKRVFAFMIPGFQHQLALLERLYRVICSILFRECDIVHKSPRKGRAVMIIAFTIDEIKHLAQRQKLNPSVVDHLQLALQNRLKVFCHRFFDFDGSKKIDDSREWDALKVAMMVERVHGLSWCLPPRYHGCSPSLWDTRLLNFLTELPPVTPLDLPACLLRRFDSSVYCYDNSDIGVCRCGWTFDSIPCGFLEFFGYSARSFARFIHSGPQENTRQTLNAVLRGPWTEDIGLRKVMVVFRVILSFWLRQTFRVINQVIGHSEIDITTIDHMAKNFRPQVLAHILRSTVSMYHDFWKSEEEANIDIYKTYINILWWAWGTDGTEDFRSSLVEILAESNQEAELSVSDDTDMSSNKDGTSDGLENGSIEVEDSVSDDTDMFSDEHSTSNEF